MACQRKRVCGKPKPMAVLELWLQTEGCPEPQAATLARMLEDGLAFDVMWQQRDAWGGMALSQLWKWRRLHDVCRHLHAQAAACRAPFLPFLADAPSVRIAAAAPAFADAEPGEDEDVGRPPRAKTEDQLRLEVPRRPEELDLGPRICLFDGLLGLLEDRCDDVERILVADGDLQKGGKNLDRDGDSSKQKA